MSSSACFHGRSLTVTLSGLSLAARQCRSQSLSVVWHWQIVFNTLNFQHLLPSIYSGQQISRVYEYTQLHIQTLSISGKVYCLGNYAKVRKQHFYYYSLGLGFATDFTNNFKFLINIDSFGYLITKSYM